MSGFYLEDLSVGQTAERRHVVTEADIQAFATASGDFNPMHMDEAYAAKTAFGGRIAHGMLSAAFISAALANDLPGSGTIYLSQTLKFIRPVRIGDEVVTTLSVLEIDPEKGRVTLETTCMVAGKAVVAGEAVVLAPRRGG